MKPCLAGNSKAPRSCQAGSGSALRSPGDSCATPTSSSSMSRPPPWIRWQRQTFFAAFLAMAGGRTTILVSHRLGSARMCDRILVLKKGRLVEEGSHDELVARNGEYARMWALQAGWYEG